MNTTLKVRAALAQSKDLRKVKGTLHWVTQNDSVDITINSYDRLFKEETPGAKNEGDFLKDINPESLQIIKAKAEPSLKSAASGDTFQFTKKRIFYG